MSTIVQKKIIEFASNRFSLIHHTSLRNILCGAGLAYAFSEDKYLHTPLILMFPSVYAGYHAFKKQDDLLKWTIKSLKSFDQPKME